MSEERRPAHPQEPAEGGDENVEAPGAEKSGDPANPDTAEQAGGQQESPHTQEPAEGGEDDAEAPGADKPSNAG
jgi:hypothetical protein